MPTGSNSCAEHGGVLVSTWLSSDEGPAMALDGLRSCGVDQKN